MFYGAPLRRLTNAAAIILLWTIAGAGVGWAQFDVLLREINSRLPAVNEWQVRTRQVGIAAAELAPPATTWDLFASLSASAASELLRAQVAAQTAALGQRGIELSDVRFTLQEQAIGVQANVRARLANPAIEISGSISGSVTPAIEGANLRLRPIVDRIVLSDLRSHGDRPRDPNFALPILQAALARLLATVNGAIPAVELRIVFPPLQPIDPAAVSVPGVRITGRPIELPAPALRAAVFLIDATGIRALVALRLRGDPGRPTRASASPARDVTEAQFRDAYRQLGETFDTAARNGFGPGYYAADMAGRVAVARPFIARVLNAVAARLDWQISLTPEAVQLPFDSEVRLAEARRDRSECSSSCRQRSCRVCAARRPWDGGCIQEVDDPVCKRASDLAYIRCQAEAPARRLNCEARKAANDNFLRRLVDAETRVGGISGTVTVAPRGTIGISRLAASENFETLTLNATVGANAAINAVLDFTPSGLIGNLSCPFPLHHVPVRATATFGPEQRRQSGRIVSSQDARLLLVTEEFGVNVRVRPPPGDALFAQNPRLNVTCSGFAALSWAGSGLRTLRIGGLPLGFTDDFPQTVGRQSISIALPALDVAIPGASPLRFSARLRERALVLDGTLGQ